MITDFRRGIRLMAAQPWYSICTIVIFALGIGANTAVISLVDSLYGPHGVPESKRLFYAYVKRPGSRQFFGMSPAPFQALSKDPAPFETVVAFKDFATELSTPDGIKLNVQGQIVSSNFFEGLRLPLSVGNAFGPPGSMSGEQPAVISYNLWREVYRNDPKVVGQRILLGDLPMQIVGVAPPGFRGLIKSSVLDRQIWVPLQAEEQIGGIGGTLLKSSESLMVAGRLPSNINIPIAATRLSARFRQIEESSGTAERPALIVLYRATEVFANPLSDTFTRRFTSRANLVSVILLFLVCANLSASLLARNVTRAHETSVRLSMGATRTRIVRQVVVEHMPLLLSGLFCGILVGFGTAHLLTSFSQLLLPFGIALPATIHLDLQLILLTTVVGVGVSLAIGLLPAIVISRSTLLAVLRSDPIQHPSGPGGAHVLRLLMALQLGIAVVVLAIATFGGLGLRQLRRADLGVNAPTTVALRLNLKAGTSEFAGREIQNQIIEKLRLASGIEARLSDWPLFEEGPVELVGMRPVAQLHGPTSLARIQRVQPGIMDLLGVRFVAGRDFVDQDARSRVPVVLVDSRTAARYWPEGQAVGQHLRLEFGQIQGGKSGTIYEIIGVVDTLRDMPVNQPLRDRVFVDILSHYSPHFAIVAKADTKASVAASRLNEIVHGFKGQYEPGGMMSLTEYVERLDIAQLVSTYMTGVLSLVALAVSLLGVISIAQYTIYVRRRETALRLALGATRWRVFRQMLAPILLVTTVATATGGIASLAVDQMIGSFLFQAIPDRSPALPASLLVFGAALLGASIQLIRYLRRFDFITVRLSD